MEKAKESKDRRHLPKMPKFIFSDLEHMITIKSHSKKEYKDEYTLRARISMRIFSILFPGMLRIEIKDKQ